MKIRAALGRDFSISRIDDRKPENPEAEDERPRGFIPSPSRDVVRLAD